jgi:flavin reductase (DIM6/NTAB) family NADH-FMN oxidoreductase RutF
MQHPAPEQLRSALQTALKRGTGAVLATVSTEGLPSTAFCSWIVSVDPDRIALALDSRSTAHRNISAGNTKVALEILADDMILAVRGTATVVKEQLGSVPFPSALVSVSISEVRDHGVDGVVFNAPTYVFADGKEHRGEVESAIFRELGAN